MSDLPMYGNAVVYSEKAWAVARRTAGGGDRWYPDVSAHRGTGGLTTSELFEWADDWVEFKAVEAK